MTHRLDFDRGVAALLFMSMIWGAVGYVNGDDVTVLIAALVASTSLVVRAFVTRQMEMEDAAEESEFRFSLDDIGDDNN